MSELRPASASTHVGRWSLLAVCYALAMAGYPIWAGVAGFIGQDENRLVTIVYRVVVALLSLWVFMQSRSRRMPSGDVLVFAAMVFWAAYLARIAVDGYVRHLNLPVPAYEMLVSSVLLAIVPALVGLIYPTDREMVQARNLIAAAILIALILVWLDSRTAMVQSEYLSRGRLAIGKLNPIGVGKIAGSLFLVALSVLYGGQRPRTPGAWLVWLTAGLLGLAFMLMSASKGPILSVLAALAVFALLPFKPGRVATMALVVAAVVVVSLLANEAIDRYLGFNFLDRFVLAFVYTDYDMSSVERIVAFNGAWEQFLRNPFWGDAIIESTTSYYPHNSILESLMATGVLGTLPFLVVTTASLIAAWKLIAWHSGLEWLGLLTIQYFLDTLTTGAHWGNAQVWLLTAAVISVAVSRRPVPASGPNGFVPGFATSH